MTGKAPPRSGRLDGARSARRTGESGRLARARPIPETLQQAAGNRATTQLLRGTGSADALPASVTRVLRSGGGQSLDPALRAAMQTRFDHDFGNVRVHTNSQAAQSAEAINANAYTVGHHIVFGPGRFAPDSPAGERLLTHELAHVVQQSRGGPPPAADSSALHERDARAAANAASRDSRIRVGSSTGVGLARDDKGRSATGDLTDPKKSPKYIDNLFESVSYNIVSGLFGFYWNHDRSEAHVPLNLVQQDDTVTYLEIWDVQGNQNDAKALVAEYEAAGHGSKFCAFFRGRDDVIVPTVFSLYTTPKFHAMWPALREDQKLQADDIVAFAQILASVVNPIPGTTVDEAGNLHWSANPLDWLSALPLLHALHGLRTPSLPHETHIPPAREQGKAPPPTEHGAGAPPTEAKKPAAPAPKTEKPVAGQHPDAPKAKPAPQPPSDVKPPVKVDPGSPTGPSTTHEPAKAPPPAGETDKPAATKPSEKPDIAEGAKKERTRRKKVETPQQPTTEKPAAPASPERATLEKQMADLKSQLAAQQEELAKVSARRKELESTVEAATKEMQEGTRQSKKKGDAGWNQAVEAKNRRQTALDELGKLPDQSELSREIDRTRAEIKRTDIKLNPKTHRAALPCFSCDTPVWTREGPRRIDRLQPGDTVLSYDPDGRQLTERTILQVHRNRTQHFYDILLGDAVIRATGPHRFWVEDLATWLPARDLRPGAQIKSMNGSPTRVISISRHDGLDTESYNLTIDGTHTYFVGSGVLAHNEGSVDIGLGGDLIVYRGTNPKYPGKVYVGQTGEVTAGGKSRGIKARQKEHQEYAAKQLEKNREGEIKLSDEDVEFYEFMEDVTLEEVVTGIATDDQADYLEQRNMDIERDDLGETLMNRREQIASPKHEQEVTERILKDKKVRDAGYCP
jgi:hypothetical protein